MPAYSLGRKVARWWILRDDDPRHHRLFPRHYPWNHYYFKVYREAGVRNSGFKAPVQACRILVEPSVLNTVNSY